MKYANETLFANNHDFQKWKIQHIHYPEFDVYILNSCFSIVFKPSELNHRKCVATQEDK